MSWATHTVKGVALKRAKVKLIENRATEARVFKLFAPRATQRKSIKQ